VSDFYFSMDQVWVVHHTRAKPHLILKLRPRREGWYVLHRRGCILRDHGPFPTRREAVVAAASLAGP
jgi:hypothetical protein